MNKLRTIVIGFLLTVLLYLGLVAVLPEPIAGQMGSFPANTFSSINVGLTSGLAGFIKFYGAGASSGSYTSITADNSGNYLTLSNPIQCPTITATGLSGAQTDYAPTNGTTACTWRLSSTGNITITGITGGWSGRLLTIINVGANNITLVTSSDVDGNDFTNTASGSIIISPTTAINLYYDGTNSAWKMIGRTTVTTSAQGGTGNATNTAHGIMIGNGASAMNVTAVGATGQVLKGVTGADPAWGYAVLLTGSGGGFTCASATTCYSTMQGRQQAAFSTTTGTTASALIPLACTLSNFYVQTLSASGANTATYSLEVNNATATGLTFTTTNDGAASLYSDTTHTYTLSAGDRVYMKIVQSSGNASAQVGGVAVLCN